MELFAWALLVCYSLSLLLVVAYFVWEDGPCHYSRRVESAYLTSVLSIIYLCSVRFGLGIFGTWSMLHDDMKLERPEDVLIGLQTLRHIMLIFVLLHLAQQFVVLRVLPAFYDSPGYEHTRREAKLWRIAMQHPKAVRIASEISHQVHSIVHVDSGLGMEKVNQLTGFILLVLIMLSEFTVACKGFYHVAQALGDVVEVLAILVCLFHLLRRLLILGPRVQALNKLVESMVTEQNEPYVTYILSTVSVATLLEVSKNMLHILTQEALNEGLLDTTSKAILIGALQTAGLRSRRRQEALARLMTSTYGAELTKLKNFVDGRGGYHNLYKLVYQDISNRSIKEKVLQHLHVQARIVERTPGWQRGVKVLSDLDDTLFSSGGKFPAGCDRSFPKGVMYPGCLSLFRALDKTFDPLKPSCNLVFLSARPHVYKEWMEEKSYNLFADLLEQERIHTFPTLLPGQLSLGLMAVLRHFCHRRNKTQSWREVGVHKYQTFQNYLRLYEEYDFIFCGDDGQGDLLAAQYMIDEEKCVFSESSDSECPDSAEEGCRLQAPCGSRTVAFHVNEEDGESSSTHSSGSASATRLGGRGRLRAVLIHEVICQEEDCTPLAREAPSERDQVWRDELRRNNLIFHKSYVGAAVELHESHPDLVTLDDLQLIAQHAVQEFEEVRIMYPERHGHWEEAESALNDDLERVNQVCADAGLRLRMRYPRGTGTLEADSGELFGQRSFRRGTPSSNSSRLTPRSHMLRRGSTQESLDTSNWLAAGGLVGAGEVRMRFMDLMGRRATKRRRATVSGTAAS